MTKKIREEVEAVLNEFAARVPEKTEHDLEISEHAKLRTQARHAATKQLVENHRAEYEQLHRAERIKRGLPPEPTAGKARVDYLQRRVEELEAELAKRV